MAFHCDQNDAAQDRAFLGVTRHIGADWKRLGRELGLEDASLEEIEDRNKSYGFQEMAYQTIVNWQQLNGKTATTAQLQTHLFSIGRKDIRVVSTSIPNSSCLDRTSGNLLSFTLSDNSLLSTSLLVEVADQLGKDWKRLGRRMEIPENVLRAIESDHGSEGVQEMAYQMLHTWKQRKPHEATREALEDHLASVDRRDIFVTCMKLSSTSSGQSKENSSTTFSPIQGIIEKLNSFRQRRQVFKNVRRYLKNEYKSLQMMGLPWMDELVLTLDDYFVELIMMKEDNNGEANRTTIELQELFQSTKSKVKPRRILIEGGPGMGKTTLAAKLAYDWSKKNSYLTDFELVILLPLRHFDGEFFDMVCRAVGITEKDRQYLFELINDPNKRILFILDGYDEASTETKANIAPLLQNQCYSSVFVIVTSRTRKFTLTNDCSAATDSRILSSADVRPTGTQFIDEKVTIHGLSSKQQTEFVKKHMTGYTKEHVMSVIDKLNQMVEEDFSKCPLFLLMLLIVFTSGEQAESIHTKTDLYKHVFNCIIRRYFCKTSDLSVQNMDIFLHVNSEMPLYVRLMTEFGKFSLSAIKTERLHFSSDEIESQSIDRRILDLGFMVETISLKGFRKKVLFEPVHKSLLEFAAAYSLWITFTIQPNKLWEQDIISLRPKLETACSSLFFPFLVGIMGMNSAAVFNVLAPYASEYTSWFGTLGFCLLETPMTEAILTSLTPFLPADWLVKWFPYDNGFSYSVQHEDIIRWGIKLRKIKIIRWDIQHPASLPNDVVLETVILAFTKKHIKTPRDFQYQVCSNKSSNIQYNVRNLLPKSIRCIYLVCLFATHQQSIEMWQTCLDVHNFFDYQHLCFVAPFFLHWFPCIYDSVISGKLPEVICRIKSSCILGNAESHHSLSQVTEMVGKVKIKNLILYMDKNYTQIEINALIKVAAKSSYLTSFTLNNKLGSSAFTVDLCQLFDGGRKEWDLVRLEGVQVQCLDDIKNSSTTKLVDVIIPTVSSLAKNMPCSLKMTSFACHCSLLVDSFKAFPHLQSVTELNIILDKSVITDGLVYVPGHFSQLRFLVLTVTNFECDDFVLPQKDWLFGPISLLCLKGLEVWKIEQNPQFASVLIKHIITCLSDSAFNLLGTEPRKRNSLSYSQSLQLDYLLLRTYLTHNLENLAQSFLSTGAGAEFISTMALLKKCLVAEILPRLDMVHVVRSSHFWPFTFGSLMGIYPPAEGFRVERDLWGSKEEDSIYSQEMNSSNPGTKERISVTFDKTLGSIMMQ